eukprot:TRINITY_DN2869_c0_g1_i2.p1 TRINITY_DN2869_c0_g1~~TRINITY_DN2869_c0_g1_i2.p1  ORF type:complete len:301 (+),score=54.01 TRINITY_DN2869_c0_g1_i2:139-1041(+)
MSGAGVAGAALDTRLERSESCDSSTWSECSSEAETILEDDTYDTQCLASTWAKSVQKTVDVTAGFVSSMALAVSGEAKSSVSEGVLQRCTWSVSVSDPLLPDVPLQALSEGFTALTGYTPEECVGYNCRFLNRGCPVPDAVKKQLAAKSANGDPFSVVMVNRRKDGELFLNFLQMRGIAVGRLPWGAERFFVVGLQTDLSEFAAIRGENAEAGSEEAVARELLAFQASEALLARLKKLSGMVRRQLLTERESICHALGESALDGLAEVYQRPRWIGEDASSLPKQCGVASRIVANAQSFF